MLPDYISNLITDGESETLELKRTTGERREGATTICAMSNTRGGRVIYGITKEGTVTGQQVSDHTIEEVSAEIQRVDPPIYPTIERVSIGGGRQLVVVTVEVGPFRPYTYKNSPYHRVGNTNLQMSRDEYNQMLFERLHNEQRWENLPATDWSVEDLDVSEIRRTVEESISRGRSEDPGTRDPGELLRGLGLVKGGILIRAAIVLFGKAHRLEADMPQCFLRVARFRGIDRTEFLDNRQFHGNAFSLISHAERFFRESLPIAGRVAPNLFERVDDPLYPPVALREALANAFCHRDYSIGGGSVALGIYDDRLEVTSTGSLHFGLTAEQLYGPHESRPWNPLIARVFYRRGLIEQWGRGTLKMMELMASAGLPRPEIEDFAGSVTVRFRPSHYVPPQRVGTNLDDQQREILAHLDQSTRGLALRQICLLLGPETVERRVREDLATLRALGLVAVTGVGRGAYWKRL